MAPGDARTPWYARAVAGLTVGLAASPIDPVPDVVPVVGSLDDLVFVPAGVLLARRLVPDQVLADAGAAVADGRGPRRPRLLGALVGALAWALSAALFGWILLGLLG